MKGNDGGKSLVRKIIITTFEIGKPEKNPHFFGEKVYPHPVIEKISNEKVDKEWQVCYWENNFT